MSQASEAFKKVKKKSVNWWKKEAWKSFSKWIRERDKYTCYTCGKRLSYDGKGMHAGHFISRKVNATFLDEQNVHAQCMYCNMWNYGSVGKYAEHLIKDYGDKGFKELLARGRKSKQFTVPELQAIKEKYDKRLETLI